jgi:hypothetical protein
MRFKLISISLLFLSGCGSKAVYLQSGTVCVLEKPVTVQASVPDSTGKLVPNTTVSLPVGTEFRYSGN